jgi:ABC-2 type transport system permease protein
MVRLLLKKQLSEIFRSYFYDAKKNKPRSKASTVSLIVLYVLLMVGVIGGMFTLFSIGLCAPLHEAGLDWLYFTLFALVGVLMGVFGSVFNTFSGLYQAKDNDLLLSLPIPVRTLMASRLLTVYLMGLMYSAVVILPAVIVYWVTVSTAPMALLGGVLLTALISIFVLTLSCALGWVVAKVSRKLKHKSFITVIVSLAGLAIYYFFVFKAQTAIEQLVANAAVYGEKIKGAAHPLYVFGLTGTGDVTAMLLSAAVILALFALTWTLLSRSFLQITTASGASGKAVYREKAVKRRSIDGALFGKELARFTASPNYMLNSGLGILLLPISGILLLWKGGTVVSLLNEAFTSQSGCAEVLLCTGVCAIASMNDMATPSVSLEGKSLWLAQSLPVKPWQVLRAKLKVQLALTALPALVPLACMAFILPVTAALPLVFAEALAYIAFSACLGLTLGVARANLTWTSELMPIKQSLAVTIALFGGWLYAIVFAGLYLWQGWKLGAAAYLAIAAAVTLAVTALLLRWLKTKGAQRFAML